MLSKLLLTLRSALVGTMWLLATASLAQTTINVPSAATPTIQSGINAAANGDTVLVAPGTYYENINFNGKAITVTSSGGANTTIIDGGANPGLAVVSFSNKETRSSVLSGFTVRHGGQAAGIIVNNNAGGGIYAYYSSPSIVNNIVSGNMCNGIVAQASAALIQGNTISNTSYAGGSFCDFQPVALVLEDDPTNTTMTNSVIGNIIENNNSPYQGIEAAIFIWVSNGDVIVGNTIRNNVSSQGEVQMFNAENVIFSQNLVYNNSADASPDIVGAALYMSIPDGGPLYGIVTNNTFVNNIISYGTVGAAQAYFSGDVSKFSFLNNVVYGSGTSPLIVCNNEYVYLSPTPMLVEDNDVYNSSGPTYDSSCANGAGMAGNIAVDPLFKNTAKSDFHLQAGSPVVDVGTNQALALLAPYGVELPTDLDGNPRLLNGAGKGCIIDMGVYEYPGTVNACETETIKSSLNPSSFDQVITITAQLTATSGVPTGDVQFADGTTVLGTENISGAGVSTYSTAQLSVGSHIITATYQPAGTFTATSANVKQMVNGIATTTSLTCSPLSIPVGNDALLTATVTSSNGTPTGSISFTDNTAALLTLALSNGTASLNYTGAVVGPHTLTATYMPTGNFAASSASCSEGVTALPTTSTLTITPTDSTYGSSITLRATVSPTTPPGPSTPTGTVTFYNGTTSIGSGTLTNGMASLTLSTISGGSANLTCSYGGSSIYAMSNCNIVPVNINPATTTMALSSSMNPAPALTPITFTAQLSISGKAAGAGYSITLNLNGQTIPLTTDSNGTVTTTISTLLPGGYPVVATFTPTSSLLGISGELNENIAAFSTRTSLTVLPNSAYLTQTVSMVATISSQASPGQLSNGNVTFYDGSRSLGTEAVTAHSTSTFTTTTLAVGTHPITATYNPPNSALGASTSPIVNEVILPSGFTIALSPATITLAGGATTTTAIELTGLGNFAGPLALTYGTLPANASVSISDATVSLAAGGTGSSTLTLNTEQRAANAVPTRPGSRALPMVFTAFVLLLVPFSFAKRRKLTRLLGVILLAVVLQALTGCYNIYFRVEVVSPGTYLLPVTATDTNGDTQTATLTINVK